MALFGQVATQDESDAYARARARLLLAAATLEDVSRTSRRQTARTDAAVNGRLRLWSAFRAVQGAFVALVIVSGVAGIWLPLLSAALVAGAIYWTAPTGVSRRTTKARQRTRNVLRRPWLMLAPMVFGLATFAPAIALPEAKRVAVEFELVGEATLSRVLCVIREERGPCPQVGGTAARRFSASLGAAHAATRERIWGFALALGGPLDAVASTLLAPAIRTAEVGVAGMSVELRSIASLVVEQFAAATERSCSFAVILLGTCASWWGPAIVLRAVIGLQRPVLYLSEERERRANRGIVAVRARLAGLDAAWNRRYVTAEAWIGFLGRKLAFALISAAVGGAFVAICDFLTDLDDMGDAVTSLGGGDFSTASGEPNAATADGFAIAADTEFAEASCIELNEGDMALASGDGAPVQWIDSYLRSGSNGVGLVRGHYRTVADGLLFNNLGYRP